LSIDDCELEPGGVCTCSGPPPYPPSYEYELVAQPCSEVGCEHRGCDWIARQS
jgi:hypothetical protein